MGIPTVPRSGSAFAPGSPDSLDASRSKEGSDQADDVEGTAGDEIDAAVPETRHSFDNLDAPWGEPHPVAEIPANRESRELPHLDDFEPPWDDPYASHDSQAIDEPSPTVVPSAPESTAPDPLWDEPRVATSANAPAEAISRSDLDFVWAPPGPEEVDLLAESRSATASPESGDTPAAPKRLSFISRLFSRKKKDEQAAIVSEFDAFVEEKTEPVSAQAPAVDDFAMGETDTAEPDAHAQPPSDEEAVAQSAGSTLISIRWAMRTSMSIGRQLWAVS